MFVNLLLPASFRMAPPPSRCSITSMLDSRPLHSWNAATCRPSISTRKLKLRNGSTGLPVLAMSALQSALGNLGAAVPEPDAHDDEFRRPDWRDLDLDVQP